jgi:hypothetical protein
VQHQLGIGPRRVRYGDDEAGISELKAAINLD